MAADTKVDRDLLDIMYRLMNNPEFKMAFTQNPCATLIECGVTDEQSQAYIINSVNNPNFWILESQQKTMHLAQRFKGSVQISLEQIEYGYKVSMRMYWVAFLAGILLIITAIVFAIVKKENLLSIVFGSLGTMDLLVFFIMKPPLELQNSRIGFARLEAAFMNWFIDMTNLNGLYPHITTAYGVFNKETGQYMINKENFDGFFDKCIKLSDQAVTNTEKTLQMMGTIIREEEEKKAKV